MKRKIILAVKFYLIPPLALFINKNKIRNYGSFPGKLKMSVGSSFVGYANEKNGTISLEKEENVRDDTSSVRGTMLLVWVVSAKQNKTDKRLLSSSFLQLWEPLNLPV